MANLVVYFTHILWTEFNEFIMNRKLLQSRLQICDLPGPTQGSPSCYERDSSEDSQQRKLENTTVIVRASYQLIDKSATDVLKQNLGV